MTKFAYILKELWRNIIKNPGTTFSALLVMTLLFLLFDLFWIAAGTSDRFYTEYLSDLQMEVFVTEEAIDSTVAGIREFIATHESVESVQFMSKEKARDELAQMVGIDLLIGYDSTNPLPRSYILSLQQQFVSTDKLVNLENDLNSLPGVSYVYYNKDWLNKAEQTKKIITDIGMVLGGLILLTVLLSSANNMRLTARSRAVGFSQMRILGAGKMMLTMPFIIEGILLGFLSAGFGWLIIYYFKDRIDFTQIIIVFPTVEHILLYCLAAGLLGVVSGYFGIRRQMRM